MPNHHDRQPDVQCSGRRCSCCGAVVAMCLALLLGAPAACAAPGSGEGRDEVLDAGRRDEQLSAQPRQETLNAEDRDEILDPGSRQEVLSPGRRDEVLSPGRREEVP